eukprot:CAMPEP_0183393492 /NCGR_PEP_ID=MMETSP0370-20130417/7976_1 /TAXON_ID=268820 /ORGANISM="Peridinium aciculiferum, Strain PAER-2" /LENGTH=473 /DNA_ID=CAMNT_0025573725 /DNA_START=66 /DNA_END=1487 /DNA_ORIENTATION=+
MAAAGAIPASMQVEFGDLEASNVAAPADTRSESIPTTSTGDSSGTKAMAKPQGGLFRHGGTLPTAVCLSKAAIGAGVLSMSAHSAEVGLAYQLVGLCIGAFLTLVSIRMIAHASIATGCWSYEDICEQLFHPSMSMLTGFVNVCNCLGSGAGYLIVCGQVFQVVTGADEHGRQLFILLMGIFVCAPLALARHVSFMRHLAAVSVAALLLLVVAVIWFYGEHGVDASVSTKSLWLGAGSVSIFSYMNSINNIVFAYNNQFNVPQLTGELTPAPTVQKMTVVSVTTVAMCFVLFSVVSLFGLLAFGNEGHQLDSLVLDLAPERREPLVMLALLGVMFSVLTCFQFHIFPIRQFAAYAARKARGRGIEDEASDVRYFGRTVTRWLDIFSALVSVSIIVLIALVVTSLKTILDFIGAFAAAYISYVVPPLWVIQVLRKQKGFTWWSAEVVSCLALFALGSFFFVFGTYSAVSDAIAA